MRRNTRTRCTPALAAVSLTLACVMSASAVTPAAATDHPLAGTRLKAKSRHGKASFAWVSRDSAAASPATSPVISGATLRVRASDGDFTEVPLEASYWRDNSSGSRSRYTNRLAPNGDSVCRLAVIADRKIVKVVCRDDLIDTLDPAEEGPVAVELAIGTDRYCAFFGGVKRDEPGRFKAAHAPAPLECQALVTTTTASSTTTVRTECPVTTTTTVQLCGAFAQCDFSECPSPQVCADDGTGQCGCTGPPVPCANIFRTPLCGLGDCPTGLQCRPAPYLPPDCLGGCSCQ